MATKPDGEKWHTVKITSSGYTILHALLNDISRDGWTCIGVSRQDTVSLGAVLDEAIAALARTREERRRP